MMPNRFVARHLLGPIWNRLNVALNDVAFEALEPGPGDRVLEVGCGGGYLLARLASAVSPEVVTGVDVSPAILEACAAYLGASRPRVELRAASAEALPFPDGHFGKLCSVNSLFFWSDQPKGVSELARVLAPGGRMVLVLTTRESLRQRPFMRNPVHIPDTDELEAMMLHAGLKALRVRQGRDWLRGFTCMTGFQSR